MNRKHFLSSIITLGTAFPSIAAEERGKKPDINTPVIPKYLKPGDMIGITCPAGSITREEIQPAILQMENWGFRIEIGMAIGKKDFGFGGSDEERTRDLQLMLDHPKIKAIMCARGGYGTIRIIDQLDFKKFVTHPKWIIGFSDITVIHNHLNHNYGIASIHSKMCNSFPDVWDIAEPIQKETILSIKDALTGVKMKYDLVTSLFNKTGISSGVLVGGNLKTIETLSGTSSDLKTDGKILFLEDTGEYLYSIDRMFWHLKRTDKLAKLKGLIIGGFKVKPDDPGEEFGKMVYDIVLEKVKKYSYPVCFDFPVGHQKNNFALKCGVPHRLEVYAATSHLKEI